MAEIIELKATDLAAMLCSRVCHDLINPVGAIGNGLEVLADPTQARDGGGRAGADRQFGQARARQARVRAARLWRVLDRRHRSRHARMRAGGAGCCSRSRRPTSTGSVPLILLPKHKAKLLMNMLLIAAVRCRAAAW